MAFVSIITVFAKSVKSAKFFTSMSDINTTMGFTFSFDRDIDVTILKKDLSKTDEKFFENKFICLLGTKQPNGLNIDSNAYGQEMYNFAQTILH